MRTLMLVLGIWTAASLLLAIGYALGAAAGYRRVIDHGRGRTAFPDALSDNDVIIRLDDVESLRR